MPRKALPQPHRAHVQIRPEPQTPLDNSTTRRHSFDKQVEDIRREMATRARARAAEIRQEMATRARARAAEKAMHDSAKPPRSR